MREPDDEMYMSYKMCMARRAKKWRPGVAAYLGAEYAHWKRMNPDPYRDAQEEAHQTAYRVFTETVEVSRMQVEGIRNGLGAVRGSYATLRT